MTAAAGQAAGPVAQQDALGRVEELPARIADGHSGRQVGAVPSGGSSPCANATFKWARAHLEWAHGHSTCGACRARPADTRRHSRRHRTYAQARRHEGEGLTFDAVSPGAVKTSLGGEAGGPLKTIQALTNPFVGPLQEEGSRGCVRLMADPELATATGGYYSSAKLKKSSKKSQDAEGQERIYAQTERELRAHPSRASWSTLAAW